MAAAFKLPSDADRSILIDRYFDLEFTDDVTTQELKCVRCQRVALVHYLFDCNHLYCRNCKNIVSMELINKFRCFKCKEFIKGIAKQDVGVDMRVYDLNVCCPNKKYGCKYSSTLYDVSEHLKNCDNTREANLPVLVTEDASNYRSADDKFESKQQSQESNKMLEMKIQQLEKRFASFQQEIARLIGQKIDEIKAEVEAGLAKKINTYEESVKANNTAITNIETVSNFLREKFTSLENKSVAFADDLLLLNETFVNLQDELKTIMQQQMTFQKQIEENQLQAQQKIKGFLKTINRLTEKTRTTFEWTINDVNQTLEQSKGWFNLSQATPLQSPLFMINGYPIIARAKFDYTSQVMSLSFHNATETVCNVDPPRVTYKLQTSISGQTICGRISEMLFGQHLKIDNSDQHVVSFDNVKNLISKSVSKDDTLVVKIQVDFPQLCERPASTNGIIKWKMDDIHKKMEGMVNGAINAFYSPYFYTSEPGFRFKAGIIVSDYSSLCKSRDINSLSLFVYCLAGEFDHLLSKNPTFIITTKAVENENKQIYKNVIKTTANSIEVLPMYKLKSNFDPTAITIEILVEVV